MKRTDEHRAALEKELAYLDRQCRELGVSHNDLAFSAGLKSQLIQQWKWRLAKGEVTVIREKTKAALHAELAKRRAEKRQPKPYPEYTEPKLYPSTPKEVVQVMQAICDDDLPALPPPVSITTPRYTSGHEALLYIIKEKLSGYTLVQLALLLAHMEGNGK